jgi:primosomal replication protein N
MSDFNMLFLIGRIGAAMKEGTASNGSKYMYFSIEIQSKQTATSVERNQYQTLHVMVFKKNVIDYLRKVGAKQGNTVIVKGYISAFPNTVNGKDLITNAITASEVYVVKVKPDSL